MTKTIQLSISNAIISGLGLISTIIFQRYVIDEVYGSTLLVLGYASLIISTIDIGNDAKFLGEKRKDKWDNSQVSFLVIRCLLLVLTLLLIQKFIAFESEEYVLLVLLSISGFLSRLLSFVYLFEHDIKLYFASLFLNVSIKILCLYFIVIEKQEIIMLLLCLFLVSILYKIIISLSILKALRFEFKPEHRKWDLWYILYGILLVIIVRAEVLMLPYGYSEFEYAVLLSLTNLAMALPIVITNSIFLIGLVSRNESSPLHKNVKFVVVVILAVVILSFGSASILKLLYGQEWAIYANLLRLLLFAFVGGIVFANLEPYFIKYKMRQVIAARSIQASIHLVLLFLLIFLELPLVFVGLAIVMNRVFIWLYYTISYEKKTVQSIDKSI